MKKYLSTGFIILLPIALTVWIIQYLLNLFTDPLFEAVENSIFWYEKNRGLSLLHHEFLVSFFSRLIAFFLTLLLIFLLGFLARRFFFGTLLSFANKIMIKIPFIGTIYRLTKDVTQAMFTSGTKAFKQTVLVPFPTYESKALSFVTGEIPPALKKAAEDAEITVFVPTAPHPISGYVLFTSRKMIHPVEISTEDTFKFLLSCGAIEPTPKK
jgi:uncharacterized membrane protein